MTTQPLTSQQYEMADLDEAIEFYYRQGWTDGLPVAPPTPQKVTAALEMAGLAPADVLGVVPVRGRVVTAEKVAINAIMAGCLPEYVPVVVAAVRAICDDPYNLHGCATSTMGASVLLVINGPVRHRLEFNSGTNVFGPGWRANATVGRALRLVLMNVCGTIPDVLDRSTMGHPGKYSFCFAEDEEYSPWEPLHVERGLSAESSAVTAFAAMSPWQVGNGFSNTPEGVLTTVADVMRAVGSDNGEIMVVIAQELMRPIKESGWTKKQVRQFLYDHAQRTAQELVSAGRAQPTTDPGKDRDPVPVCRDPQDIILVPAGGPAGVWAAVIPMWGFGVFSRSVTKEIDTSRI